MKNMTHPAGRRYSAEDQAKALAVVLREEFGVPVAFYEAENGGLVWCDDINALREHTAVLKPNDVLTVAKGGRARVSPARGGYFQFALPLTEAGRTTLVATGAVPALATVESLAAEHQRTQRWVQAVGDRLRSTDQLLGYRRTAEEQSAQVKQAWEVIFALDHLLRRLRLHKDPHKNQQRILEAAHELMSVQALVWVPSQPDAQVLVQGEARLAPSDCRQLANYLARSIDSKSSGPVVINNVQEHSWGAGFPHVVSVMGFRVHDQRLAGWVIAINKRPSCRDSALAAGPNEETPTSSLGPKREPSSSTEFRRSDAAILTPFVGALEMYERGSRRYQDLKNLLVGLTRSLTSALDTKDSYTYGHSERVARIAVELGREMGMSDDELGDIYLAGLLHDVGKIGIRDAVLGKAEPLTPEEFEHIKQHVTMGYAILADLGQIRNLLPGVLYHHERYDGAGYPDGLVGEAIPLLARILAVADAYDAMSTTRPYREALACRKVEEILLEGAGKQWDRRIVEAFMRSRHKVHAIRQRGVGESLRQAIEGALRKGDISYIGESVSMPKRELTRA
jgi:HD-GYP domain-containing protein (c-di-GMP phosphodiesterase class II)